MYRSLSGVKAQYHYLTLVAVSEFDEWRILVYGPNVVIQGGRQFGEAKAKEHALSLARHFIHEEKHDSLPELPSVEWSPTAHDDWLLWQH